MAMQYLNVVNEQREEAPPPVGLSKAQRLGLLLCAVADIATFIPLYLLRYHYRTQDIIDNDVKTFNPEMVGKSLVDVMVLLIIRVLLVLAAVLHAPALAYYHSALMFCAWLAIAKLIVATYWSNAPTVAALICNLVFCSLYWYLSTRYTPPPTEEERRKKRASYRSVLKIFKPYFWPDGIAPRLRVLSTWLFLAVSKTANIMAPLFASRAVGQLQNERTLPYLYIGLFAGLILLSKVMKELQSLVYLKVKQTAFGQVAVLAFAHVHTLSLEWHLTKKMGQVLRAMDRGISAADNVVQYLCLLLLPTVVECVVTMGIFWAHFRLPILAAIALLSFAMYCWLTMVLTLWRNKYREKTNRHDNEYHDKATDSLVNYETVKYFANEGFERDRYAQSIGKFQKYSVATQASLSVLNSAQQVVVNVCLCLGLMEAGYAVLQGELPIGDFVAVQIYIANLFNPLSFLGTIYAMVVQATIDMQNLSELLAQDPDIRDIPGAMPLRTPYDARGVQLEFQKVAFHYSAQPPESGLQDISFVVPPGTTTAIVGHTGAGKTTISRLLFRFYDVKGGQILIEGQNISKVTQDSLRRLIGMVPQDTVMFNDTILYNIQYGNLSATFEEVEQAAAAAQILDFIRGLPEGWQTAVGERGLKLSGGEKQRVAIARCLLKNPSLVILDEATSALDTRTEKEVQAALQCLKGRTTLVIAHRLSTVRGANQILVLGQGRVLEQGTHEELMERRGEYYAMCLAQIEAAPESPAEPPSPLAPPA